MQDSNPPKMVKGSAGAAGGEGEGKGMAGMAHTSMLWCAWVLEFCGEAKGWRQGLAAGSGGGRRAVRLTVWRQGLAAGSAGSRVWRGGRAAGGGR